MKKIAIAILVFALAATMAACGCQNRSNTDNSSTQTSQATTTPTTATIIDPTIMDPTIETNIPDPDINTEATDFTGDTGNSTDNTITDGTGTGTMN